MKIEGLLRLQELAPHPNHHNLNPKIQHLNFSPVKISIQLSENQELISENQEPGVGVDQTMMNGIQASNGWKRVGFCVDLIWDFI
jgi:hypothetical protein